jgi:hypothetical protein
MDLSTLDLLLRIEKATQGLTILANPILEKGAIQGETGFRHLGRQIAAQSPYFHSKESRPDEAGLSKRCAQDQHVWLAG